jgi:DUF3108-like
MYSIEYNPTNLALEMDMNRRLSVVIIVLLITFVLSSCNLPRRISNRSQAGNSSSMDLAQGMPTPTSLCAYPYFPNIVGDMWEYSGSNSFIGDYSQTDTITSASGTTFTQETIQGNVSYSVPYDCTTTGITSTNPVQQYVGALLNSPDTPVNVKLSSNTGTSLPANINPGDSWQQTADFEAASNQLNVNGRFLFDYTAAGFENITVAAGTFNALRVNITIRIEVTGLHILAGTYSATTWLAPGFGIVKSEGTSHVSGIEFSDSMQLTSFTPAP